MNKERIALITGGGNGICLEVAKQLAKDIKRVIILDKDAQALKWRGLKRTSIQKISLSCPHRELAPRCVLELCSLAVPQEGLSSI